MGYMFPKDHLAKNSRPWKMNFQYSRHRKHIVLLRSLKEDANQSMIVKGHSISKSKANNHPLPEEDEKNINHNTTNRLFETDDFTLWDGVVSGDGDPNLSNGNSTDRSFCSSSSWADDDEFDRQATSKVRKMFDDIERALFEDEEELLTNQLLKEECHEWKSKYPHLRIIGSQLLPPQDLGYQIVPREPILPLETVDLFDSESSVINNAQGLAVTGKHICSILLSKNKLESYSGTSSLEEEVFEEEGHYEEFLAFDDTSIDDDRSEGRYRSVGVPPLTPTANVKDSIMSSIFDLVWTELIGGMSGVLKLYCDNVLKDSWNKSPNNPHRLSGIPRNIENFWAKIPPAMPFQQPSSSQFQKQKPLDGVLTISSKTLLNRSDKTALLDVNDFRFNLRPTSGTMYKFSIRPVSMRASELMTSSNSRQTSARKATPRGRLLPLEAPKTSTVLDDERLNIHEILRGTRLPVTKERLLSPFPASSWSRSTHAPLPPIDSFENIPQSRQQSNYIRDIEDRVNHRDKSTTLPLDVRCNTPHSAKVNSVANSHRASTSIGFNTSRGLHSPFALRGQHILAHTGKTTRSAKSLSAKAPSTKSSNYHHSVP